MATIDPPFKLTDGLVFRLRSRKGLKNKDDLPDWYLAYSESDGTLISNGGYNKSSEWMLKADPTNEGVFSIKAANSNHFIAINDALEVKTPPQANPNTKMKLFFLDTGKVCVMSFTHKDKKNRAGGAGPHLGVQPRGELIGNAGRGEWGQFDFLPTDLAANNTNLTKLQKSIALNALPLSDPQHEATQLLFNHAKHRELFYGQFIVETKPVSVAKALLNADFKLPNMKVDKWAVFCAAPPSPMPSQNVKSASLKVYNLKNELVSGSDMKQTENGHYMLRSMVHGYPHNITAKYEIEAQLYSMTLKRAEPGQMIPPVPMMGEEQRAYHLKKTSLMDFDSVVFQNWVTNNRLHPMPTEIGPEPLLCYAYRVFLFIKIHFSYIYAKDVKSRKASDTIVRRATDCGGFCILYAAIMRMHGIPCRLLFGRWAATTPEPTGNVHVKGEFYCDGVGWIPYDPASAITNDHTAPYTKCFGSSGGNFITMHFDHNIQGLETIIQGKKNIEFSQGKNSTLTWTVNTN
ncbi:hypothetical protein PPL_01665 [Heterostelium album PN500]|uniref:Transglutaminase-like domain-containing protein n=1 Tax=Heterostelium pallidum (strain ATCC 26659 / Pp 5 / PN500) TaxID=670386 RepID=D3B050_HETP5|nr:hypothetical protein PPL_01665 [Heterostelium album PN500]EFA84674.1 hypothetical protein PPL_01665 [Heterostelium album PN500]|eukprot:XP_020436787.1 hypothetical protein PPL_01665 [Heterostelium album PN500]